MIKLEISGHEPFLLKNLVLDYNGTIAFDGVVLDGITPMLSKLSESLDIYIITADTHGSVKKNLFENGLEDYTKLYILPQAKNEAKSKKEFVESLDEKTCISIGNGYNDRLMLSNSRISIAVLGDEGCHVKALNSADIVCKNIKNALELFLNQKRLMEIGRAHV